MQLAANENLYGEQVDCPLFLFDPLYSVKERRPRYTLRVAFDLS